MGKKKRGAVDEDSSSRGVGLPVIIAGGMVLLVAVVVGSVLGTIFIVGTDDGDAAPELPTFVAEAPAIERSGAADLLASKSVDDMSPEERDLVRTETIRVYADAQFRATNPAYAGIDVYRRGGDTLASRVYTYEEAPGGITLVETLSFFCTDEASGVVTRFRAARNPAGGLDATEVNIQDGQQAMERLLDDLDWSTARDLGLDDVNGRQARGVELQYHFSDDAIYRTHVWIDIENARVLRYVQYGDGDTESFFTNYDFDWRIPPRIERLPDHDVPCYDEIYP